MKRIVTLLLVLSLALCLVACGEDATTPTTTTTQPVDPTTTQPTTTTTAPEVTYNYKIRVVDQDGTPIEGATIMFCLDTCDFFVTDAEGWAKIDKPVADGYQAKILALPAGFEGYTFSGDYTNLESGQTELTLVATKPAA